MEDLVRYLKDIVEPTVAEFEVEPTSVRKAFLACVVVYHSVDYLAAPRKPGNLIQRLRQLSPAFAIVDRVAHAFKHTKSEGRDPIKVEEVISRPPARFDEAVWDISQWDDPQGSVTLDRNRDLDLLEVLKSAVDFLKGLGERSID